jgi:amphiphysin
MIQNTLLAQYYTVLHNYCEETGLPSPPPPMEDVIAVWSRDFKPIQQEVESINCIARGKAVHQPMSLGDDGGRKSITGLGVRNGIANRRASSQTNMISSHPVSPNPEARVMRIPSSNSVSAVVSRPAPEPSPSPEPTPTFTSPDYSTHLTPQSSYSTYSPAGPTMDYFQRGAATKKKPPPPPPKRIGSQNSGVYAVALYSFDGQNPGDLSFKEGDQIKVIKKTGSVDDWWEGELRGVKGSFPANYCKVN